MNIEEAKRAIRELDASAQEPAMALWIYELEYSLNLP
ncbi:Uncharacterised protein [Streptococcus pyogenes]|nr:Uncharacterised protein [Streptococcus pyogenes]VHB66229.1 Uncharacterised protein [Streptococcus pyogenes]VHC55524.1 Uncharacterised protein [Streptococcus pyogenes]